MLPPLHQTGGNLGRTKVSQKGWVVNVFFCGIVVGALKMIREDCGVANLPWGRGGSGGALGGDHTRLKKRKQAKQKKKECAGFGNYRGLVEIGWAGIIRGGTP